MKLGYACNDTNDDISVMYQFNFENNLWSKRTTNIKYFGSLAIMNGIKYFINILNKENIFGYFYDSRNKLWIQLTEPQLDSGEQYENLIMEQMKQPVILVPYFKSL